MYQQTVYPDLDITYTGGFCQKAEENTFGRNGVFGSATIAWNAETEKHYDYPPAGISVPVYFSIAGEPDGHVATWLPDGRIASSSLAGTHKGLYIHRNIDELVKFYSSSWKLKYLGWGESVGKIKVVEKGAPMSTIATKELVDSLAHAYLNDSLESNPGLSFYVGQPLEDVISTFNASKQRDTFLKNQANVLTIANIRGERLENIAKLVGAKNGDDYDKMISNIANPDTNKYEQLSTPVFIKK